MHTWTDPMPGYSELHIDGRVRGYVENATRMAFWNYRPRTSRRQDSFAAIAPPGAYSTVEAAKDALEEYVYAKDAACDGTRGIQGKHTGCSPARCAPKH